MARPILARRSLTFRNGRTFLGFSFPETFMVHLQYKEPEKNWGGAKEAEQF